MQKHTGIRMLPSVVTIKGFQCNLFSCRHVETSSDLLLQKSIGLGYEITFKLAWSLHEHRFVILESGFAA